jgi:serine protease Do
MILPRLSVLLICALTLSGWSARASAQVDPTQEPSVIAVAKIMPAVVNINTERVVRHTVRDPYDEFFNNFFGGPMRPPRLVKQTVQSLGSGFIVDPKGFIVTNEHVVQRAADLKISVTTNDGKTYDARFVTSAPEADLAFIKIESNEPLAFVNLDDLSPNLLGQSVLVLGNPLGYGSSVARGILSAKGRAVTVENKDYKDLIQTDAAINPGNSGGPVVDLSGKLVGVSSVKMAFTPQGVPTQGLGFAIPAKAVRDKVVDFQKFAAGQKPATTKPATTKTQRTRAQEFFGLQLQDLTAELADTMGYDRDAGVVIADVEQGSPAERAGFKRGLVISMLGRYRVSSSKQVEDLLEPVSAGSVVDFTVGLVRTTGRRESVSWTPVTLTAR